MPCTPCTCPLRRPRQPLRPRTVPCPDKGSTTSPFGTHRSGVVRLGNRVHDFADLSARDHRNDPGDVLRVTRVDRADPGMGMWTAQYGAIEHPRKLDIVD